MLYRQDLGVSSYDLFYNKQNAKRVSQDLVYSLFGLSTDDSPYKTALEVVLALNGHPKSPFYKRIKLYGGNYDKSEVPPLSQATMVKSIVALISVSLRESEMISIESARNCEPVSPLNHFLLGCIMQ